jgi:polysaccharide pyruvyl transferase WcaK-like protein
LAWIVVASLLYRGLPLAPVRRVLSRATPWIAALESVDFAGDVRGGDSFSDIYGLRRFIGGSLVAWTVLLVKGSIVQFPQTYGPYRSWLARRVARYLLKRSSVIVARDDQSRQVAQELVGLEKEVYVSPDVAFSLEAVRPSRLEVAPPLSSGVPPDVIGVNINGLMFNGGYTRKNMFGLELDYPAFLPALVTALLTEHRGELWLVPHTYGPPESVESDPEACRRVRAALPLEVQQRVRIVAGEYDCHEIKGVISQCDFFIGSRMHACIAALSQGIPCAGVAYSMKFAGVFETVGMGDWVVDGRTATNNEAVARILELYRKRDGVRDGLRARALEARQQLERLFRSLMVRFQERSSDAVSTSPQAHALVLRHR